MMPLIWVPPTTIEIRTSILEYVRGASNFERQALLSNGTPVMNRVGQVLEDFQHVVAAAVLLGVPRIQVYLDE